MKEVGKQLSNISGNIVTNLEKLISMVITDDTIAETVKNLSDINMLFEKFIADFELSDKGKLSNNLEMIQ